MGYVTINGRQVEVDRYGRIVGALVEEDLYTSDGVVKLQLRRIIIGKRIVIEADMWRSEKCGNLDNSFTMFRASCFMKWEHDRYRIEDKRYRDCNDYWRELETLISNVLMQHE